MSSRAIVLATGIPAQVVCLDEAVAARVDAAVARAQAITAVSRDNMGEVDAAILGVNGLLKSIEDARTALKKPVLDLGKALDAAAKDATAPLSAEKARLSGLVLGFQRAEAEKARIAAEKARAEQARLEQEQREREDLARVKAQAFNKPVVPPPPVVRPVVYAHPPPPPPPSMSVTARKVKVLVIDDPAKVPVRVNGFELRPISESAVKLALSSGIEVPGARLEEREIAVTR